jgi:hypothetical protein
MGGAILLLPQMYSWRAHGQLYLYPSYRQHGCYKQTTAERALGIKKYRRPVMLRRCIWEDGPESTTGCRGKISSLIKRVENFPTYFGVQIMPNRAKYLERPYFLSYCKHK